MSQKILIIIESGSNTARNCDGNTVLDKDVSLHTLCVSYEPMLLPVPRSDSC